MSIKLTDLLNPTRLVALYENGTSLSMEGPPGVGKSTVTRLIPEILSKAYGETFGYVEQLAPSLDAPDVRGFMVPTKDETGRAVSKYTYPAIMPSPEYLKAHPRGVAFIDEFGQSEPLTQKALAPFLLEGRIGDYTLGNGWWVITASNRMSDRSGVMKPMMHNVNRQRRVEIRPDLDSWVAWARENEIHPMGITFAMKRPDVVFSDTVPVDPRPFCTPRSFVSAMRLMQGMVGYSMDLPSDTVTQELVQGDIGEAAAADFFGFIKVADELPDIDDIINRPQTAKVPSAERLDAALAAQQLCIHHANPENIEPVWEYSVRLPRELQVSTAMALMERHQGALLNSKGLGKWVSENRALIINTTA